MSDYVGANLVLTSAQFNVLFHSSATSLWDCVSLGLLSEVVDRNTCQTGDVINQS